MTKDETKKFLESYQKSKSLEKIDIATIEELQRNATTAKGINYESDQVQGSKRVLPEMIYAYIIDLKESLVRKVYSNTIRLKYIEEYIYKVGEMDTRLGTVLCYKYVLGMRNTKIEMELRYSPTSVKQFIKDGLNLLASIMADESLSEIERKIFEESQITPEMLDAFYEKLVCE